MALRRVVPVLTVALISVVPFLPALGNNFVYDDFQYLVGNVHIAHGLTVEAMRWAFTTTLASNWHPLTWLSYLLDVELFGPGPRGHHLVNILLHAANASLLYVILRHATGSAGRSLFAALLFAVHPLRVESVAWAAERKDVLSTTFGFLAVAAHLRVAAGGGAAVRLLTGFCMALSLMAKPMLVTLPVLLFILDWWPCGRRGVGRLLLEKVPLVFLSAISVVVTLIVQENAMVSLGQIPATNRIALAISATGAYLARTVAPIRLSAFYPLPETIPTGLLATSGTLLIAVSTVALLMRRGHPALLAGWVWYLISLMPVAGLIQAGAQASADRYTYVPSIGVAIAAVWLTADLVARHRFPRIGSAALAVVAIAALGALAWRQCLVWKDNETLFRQAIASTERNHLAHFNLAVALSEKGQDDEALTNFFESVRLRPGITRYRLRLGFELGRRGSLGQAVYQYQQVLRAEPGNVVAHIRLGDLLVRRGDRDEAAVHLRKALELDPKQEAARILLRLIESVPDQASGRKG